MALEAPVVGDVTVVLLARGWAICDRPGADPRWPFDTARLQLAYGAWLRRRRRVPRVAPDLEGVAVGEGRLWERPGRVVVAQQQPAGLLVPDADPVPVEQRGRTAMVGVVVRVDQVRHRLVTPFESVYGRILHYRVWRKGEVGLILAARHRSFWTHFVRDRPQSLALEYHCPDELAPRPELASTFLLANQIVTDAKRTLGYTSLTLCLEMIYVALEHLFDMVQVPGGILPWCRSAPFVTSDVVDVITKQLNKAMEYTSKAAAGHALSWYIIGMIGSLAGLLAVLLLTFNINLANLIPAPVSPTDVYTTLIAGGIGATFSVMIRATRGELSVVRDVSTLELMLNGAFRPLIGVISGVFLYLVSLSTLLPLQVPQSPRAMWSLYAVLAFVAGFSERLAQDTIVRTGSQLVQRSPETETTAAE